MSAFVNVRALLSDARLRVAGLHEGLGVLLVEGPDDQRIFAKRCAASTRQICVAGSKGILLDAYHSRSPEDEDRLIFFADCDYDVPTGNLRGGEAGLILTQNADADADLASLPGVIADIVTQLVPSALHTGPSGIAADVMAKAVALAGAVGRVRKAARLLGIPAKFDTLSLCKFRDAKQVEDIALARVCEVVRQRSGLHANDRERLYDMAQHKSVSIRLCNGHDLIGAIRCVLRQDYGVKNSRLETLPEMIRLAAGENFEQWPVTDRMRQWEAKTGARLFH